MAYLSQYIQSLTLASAEYIIVIITNIMLSTLGKMAKDESTALAVLRGFYLFWGMKYVQEWESYDEKLGAICKGEKEVISKTK